MPEGLTIFAPAWSFVDARLTAVLGERLPGVMAEIAGPLRLALVLYVVLYGLAILRGAISEPVMDFAIRTIKLVVIYAVAVTPAYGDYVTIPLFETLPDTMAQIVSGGRSVAVGEAFDRLLNMGGYLAERVVLESIGIDPAPAVVAVVVFLAGALAAAIGFGVVMIAKISLALLVTLGPIFIALSLFEASRRYFFGWLSQAVNYLVLFALTLAVAQLVLDLVQSQWADIEASEPMIGALAFTALCLLAAFFFLHTPWLATGIAGGASAGVGDFANAAQRALDRRLSAQGPSSARAPAAGPTRSSAT